MQATKYLPGETQCNAPGGSSHFHRWRPDLDATPSRGTPLSSPTRPIQSTQPPPSTQPAPATQPLPPAPSATPAFAKSGKCPGVLHTNGREVRNCSTCTHRLCQKCCLAYQRIYPESTCTQKSHHPKLPAPTPTPASGSWSAIEALPATPDPATATATSAVDRDFFYDSTKPLHQAQYDAKMEARESFKAQREAVEERERQLEKLKQYVQILYWNQVCQ